MLRALFLILPSQVTSNGRARQLCEQRKLGRWAGWECGGRVYVWGGGSTCVRQTKKGPGEVGEVCLHASMCVRANACLCVC